MSFRAFDAVLVETPASAATSVIRGSEGPRDAIRQLLSELSGNSTAGRPLCPNLARSEGLTKAWNLSNFVQENVFRIFLTFPRSHVL